MFRVSRLAFVLPVLALGCDQNARGPVSIPGTPDGTVRAVFDGMVDRDPRVLWAALPGSYQKDITGLIHQFATSVDKEIYDDSFELVRKVARVLREKKSFILNHPMISGMLDRDKVSANWNSFVGLFETIANSELSNVSSLAKLDVEECLAGTGAELFEHLMEISKMSNDNVFASLRKTTVQLVKSESGVATVKVSAPAKPTEEIKLTKVEGRWIPTDMVEEWSENITKARKGLNDMVQNKGATAMQAKMALGMIGAVLDQLDKAKTQEEFNKTLSGLLGGFSAPPK